MINLFNRRLNSEINTKDHLRQLFEFLLPVRLYTGVYSAKTNISSLADPVCGKKFKSAKYAGAMLKIGSKEYYFCSMECKTKFMKNPEKYWYG